MRYTVLILLAAAAAAAERPRADVDMTDWPLRIGTEAQLFIDDYLVAEQRGLTRRLHQPEKHPANPLLSPPPGESYIDAYGSILRDPVTGRFRMWYTNRIGIAYAESGDGIRWERPAVGMKIEGRKTNQLTRGHRGRSDTLTVLMNPNTEEPARRYLAYVMEYRYPDRDGVREQRREGIYLRTSPDGIAWTERAEPVIHGPWRNPEHARVSARFELGDVHHIDWDPRLGRFMGHLKLTENGERMRGLAESEDGIHWSEPRLIMRADREDRPGDQIYSLIVFPYESLWLGLTGIYHKGTDERLDIQLAVSRDGRTWSRPIREPFVPNGPAGAFDWGVLHMAANPPLLVEGKLRFYYSGFAIAHNMKTRDERSTGIGVAMLRPDGFVSIEAGAAPGLLLTRPFLWRDGALRLNATTRQGGAIRVEVTDSAGTPVPGYTLADCEPVRGDGVDLPVRWKGGAVLPGASPDRHYRLRFEIRDGELYAFRAGV